MRPPDYERGPVKLWCGDSLELLPELPQAEGVDAVITDPPYNARTHENAKGGHAKPLRVDFECISAADIAHMFSLCSPRRWLVATVAYQHAVALQTKPPAGLNWIRFGIWRKPNAAPQFTGDRPGMGWEAVAILHRKKTKMRWNGGGRHAVWRHNLERGRLAERWGPTAKPLSLLLEFVDDFTDKADAVMDPYMGSGTTGVACIRRGRRFLGSEIDPEHFETAVQRLDAELRQGRLF